MKSITRVGGVAFIAAAAFVVFVPNWTHVRSAEEVGFPQEIVFHRDQERAPINQAPASLPPATEGGPSATEAYRNVKVLTDVSAAEFMRLQTAITAWVSPGQGCDFCHTGNDFASDAKPTKAAARVMLQMTRHLNADWANHVAGAGVTCFSCHRGQPVPAEIWFPDPPQPNRPFVAKQDAWNEGADTVRKFFPTAGFVEYFLGDQPIAVQSTVAGKNGTLSSQGEAKRIYEMMMQMSDGIGVNCGYCHNSRNFQSWSESTPYRWVGYDAIRLVRDLNRNYLLQIGALVPQTRSLTTQTDLPVLPERFRNPQLGNGMVNCATCHMGLTKPLNGANMVQDYPGLGWHGAAPSALPAGLAPATAIPSAPVSGG